MITRALRRIRFLREHRWTHTHLSNYIDRGLDDPDHDRVEQHVGLCPQCHRMLATLRLTVVGLRSLKEHPPPPLEGVAEGVLVRFREES